MPAWTIQTLIPASAVIIKLLQLLLKQDRNHQLATPWPSPTVYHLLNLGILWIMGPMMSLIWSAFQVHQESLSNLPLLTLSLTSWQLILTFHRIFRGKISTFSSPLPILLRPVWPQPPPTPGKSIPPTTWQPLPTPTRTMKLLIKWPPLLTPSWVFTLQLPSWLYSLENGLDLNWPA